MTFNTYIINLDKDVNKYKKLSKSLNSKNINHERFSAIYGKHIGNKYNNHIMKHKCLVPKNILGIGLSHYFVCKNHFEKSDDYAFVLEDDAVLLFDDKNDVEQIIKSAPPDWDIILLYAQGITNYRNNTWNTSFLTGSAIAYIINKNGYNKWFGNNFKVDGHVDATRIIRTVDGTNLKVYKTPVIMVKPDDTNISSSSTNYGTAIKYFDNIINCMFCDTFETRTTYFTASQAIKYKLLRIPYLDIELDAFMIVIIVLLIIIITYCVI